MTNICLVYSHIHITRFYTQNGKKVVACNGKFISGTFDFPENEVKNKKLQIWLKVESCQILDSE